MGHPKRKRKGWGQDIRVLFFISHFLEGKGKWGGVWRDARYPHGKTFSNGKSVPFYDMGSWKHKNRWAQYLNKASVQNCLVGFVLRHILSHAIFLSPVFLLIWINVHPVTWNQSIFFQLMYVVFSLPRMGNSALVIIRLNYMELVVFNHFWPS